jgi:hypothetical protein
VIVESDLAPGYNLWVLRQLVQARVEVIIQKARFVGVNSYGCIDKGMFFGDSKGRRVRIARDLAIPDVDYDVDAGVERPPDCFFPVVIEPGHLDM